MDWQGVVFGALKGFALMSAGFFLGMVAMREAYKQLIDRLWEKIEREKQLIDRLWEKIERDKQLIDRLWEKIEREKRW